MTTAPRHLAAAPAAQACGPEVQRGSAGEGVRRQRQGGPGSCEHPEATRACCRVCTTRTQWPVTRHVTSTWSQTGRLLHSPIKEPAGGCCKVCSCAGRVGSRGGGV